MAWQKLAADLSHTCDLLRLARQKDGPRIVRPDPYRSSFGTHLAGCHHAWRSLLDESVEDREVPFRQGHVSGPFVSGQYRAHFGFNDYFELPGLPEGAVV